MYVFATIIRDTEKYEQSEICKLKIKILLNIIQDGVIRQNFRDKFQVDFFSGDFLKI